MAGGALRQQGVVRVKNVPVAVAVAGVEHRQRLDAHGVLELLEALRTAHAVPLLDLPELADASVTNRKHPPANTHRWPVDRVKNFAVNRPTEVAPKPNLERRQPPLQIEPFAIDLVLVFVFRIKFEFEDVNKIRLVDRVSPGDVLVVAKEDDRRTGEQAAVDILPLLADQMRLIPSHRAGPRLM